MRRVLLTFILSVSILSANFFGEDDKKMHIAFSIPFGMLGATICKKEFELDGTSMVLCGTAIGMIAGISKETYDQYKYGGWDNRDLGADAIGAFIGSIGTVTIFKFSSGEW